MLTATVASVNGMTKSPHLQGCKLCVTLRDAYRQRYLVSYAIFRLGKWLSLPLDLCSVTALRSFNLILICVALPLITKSLYRQIHASADRDMVQLAALFPSFPLLSFFGNLYYTDVLSTTTVLYCYLLAIRKKFIFSAMVSKYSHFVATSLISE